MKIKKLYTLFIIISFFFYTSQVINGFDNYSVVEKSNENSNNTLTRLDISLIVQSPIKLYNDTAFASFISSNSLPGDGTQQDPYIIENFLLEESTDHPLHIKDVSYNFVIRNNIIKNGNASGINLERVSNVEVFNNTLINNGGDVIDLNSTSHVFIHQNRLYDSKVDPNRNDGADLAMDLRNSEYVIAEYNVIKNASRGMWIWITNHSVMRHNVISEIYTVQTGLGVATGMGIGQYSYNNSMYNNTVYGELTAVGMWLWQNVDGFNLAENNTVTNSLVGLRVDNNRLDIVKNNTFLNNIDGIKISVSNNVSMSYNRIENSRNFALKVDGRNHSITRNSFIENNKNVQDISFSDTNNYDYNYWDNWTSPDTNEDGIVDNPFVDPELGEATDNYPLVDIPIFGNSLVYFIEPSSTAITTSSIIKTNTTVVSDTTSIGYDIGIGVLFIFMTFIPIILVRKFKKEQ